MCTGRDAVAAVNDNNANASREMRELDVKDGDKGETQAAAAEPERSGVNKA